MFDVKPLTGAIGAEITGVDLNLPISDRVAKALRVALWRHLIIVFRDQFLDISAQKRLTEVFGEVMRLPYVEPTNDDPDVIAVLKEASEHNVGVFGGEWHSDFSFLERPPSGSVLNAVEVPDYGGDTLWANQASAYEALPADLRKIVEGRDAIHVGKPYGVKYAPPKESRAASSIRMTRGDPDADREIHHPAVIEHPHSGRKALFLNPIYTTRFDGMSDAESAPLLEAIYKHCIRPEFCCRLRWSPGAVAVWDNRMTLHYAVNDYDGVRRLLYRTTFVDVRH
ncbi:TauD/TfdA family dioxygenase [Pelagibius sp. Alg239-R121]|uniref:TauD/TfdA dioxygenase family protein n=1 Tax=Pelagibius sp. Alg239-R121 TaxID=2993448 RepID=UPI0024A6B30C|nr:TauD/TfdA family dioxygenase [Pelagibius sp. Alg239-R121]